MTSIRKKASLVRVLSVLVLALFLVMTTVGSTNAFVAINPPPFDFTDLFYQQNGINLTELNAAESQRFGKFRLTGPPAGPGQVNWVIDNSNTEPIRNNVRILATTGGYRDDSGTPTRFISIIALAQNQTFFAPPGSAAPFRQSDGTTAQRSVNPDARGPSTPNAQFPNAAASPNTMHDIVAQFEAYAGIKQKLPDGTFAFQPCSATVTTNCFSTDVSTPNLRQDWRFSDNRQHYFCDDLLGMWIITFFFFTPDAFTSSNCKAPMAAMAARNGLSLDGTPIIKTGSELNGLEHLGCAKEFNNPEDGSGGTVWLVCPSILDPGGGAIAPDAFLDAVRKPDGSFLDPQIAANFSCLQNNGAHCPLANGTYFVVNETSDLVWDDHGTGKSGDNVILDAMKSAPSQKWTFTVNANGTYTIANANSGLVLDNSFNTSSGTVVTLQKFSGGANQQWTITPTSNGSGFTIASAASGLQVDSGDPKGVPIVQATPNNDEPVAGVSRQIWLIDAGGTPDNPI